MLKGVDNDKSGGPVPLLPVHSASLSLAQNLEQTGRHPVLIFGSQRSGKSSLIMSFIQTLHETPDIDIQLGAPVLDRADPRCAERHQAARNLYERLAHRYGQGVPLPATQGDPFFVPIDVMPRNSRLPAVKFAFLDGRGEGYMPNHDEKADFYKPLSDDIRDLLQTFSYGITTIYVAPYSMGPGHDRDTADSNSGLMGAIQGYRDHRIMRRDDFHLFLLSKWDQYALLMDPSAMFSHPQPGDVVHVLGQRYKQAWGTFQALPLEGAARDRRAFMQYSSGYFVEGRPQQPPAKFSETFLRYPRTALNWLYGNATQFRMTGERAQLTLRKILFDDVVPPHIPRLSMTERLASLLTAR